METTTEKTTPTVEETAPSASTLFADESAVATAEEAAAETTSATVDPAGEKPAAAEETAPVEPVAEETPAETPTTEEPTTEIPAETTPVEPVAEETPSTSDEAELPSGIGDEDIGGTERTASTVSSTTSRGAIKNKVWAILATVAVVVATLGTVFGIMGYEKVNKLDTANANNGGNNTSTVVPVDHDAEAISKGKSAIDNVLAGYPGYTKEGENFIQNDGTSTTVYFKMKNNSNGKTIILPLTASGIRADSYDDFYKQLGDIENSEMLVSIGDVYKSIETYKDANPASADTIDSIVANVNKVVGDGTVYVKSSTKQVNSGINMTTRFYVDGLGDKIGFSEYVKEKTAETENKFIGKMDRAMKGGYPGGRFALDKDVSSDIEAKIAEINKPVEQPSNPAEGETGAEAEDPNASI